MAKRGNKGDVVELFCGEWARWVNTDTLSTLGYPSASCGASIYDQAEDRKWRAKQKNSRCANVSLPDWKDELIMDEIVHSLNVEFRRVVYCHYEVMLKHTEMLEFRVTVRDMHLYGRDGRYTWPHKRTERIAALRMPERTFYRSLAMAGEAIIDSPMFYQLGR